MRVSDIQNGTIYTIEIERSDRQLFDGQSSIPNVKDEVRLCRSSAENTILLQQSHSIWQVRGVNKKDQNQLEKLVDRNLPCLSWISQATPKKQTPEQVIVQVHEFVNGWSIDNLEIGIDEKVVEEIRNKYLRTNPPIESILSWLSDKLLVPSPFPDGINIHRILARAGQDLTGKLSNSFQMWGREIAIDVKRTDEDKLRIERVTVAKKQPKNEESRPFILLTTQMTFCDYTNAGTLRDSIRTELDALVSNADSYINLWHEYNKIERDIILEKARSIGWLRYEYYKEINNSTYRFFVTQNSLDQLFALREMNESLEAGENEPDLSLVLDSLKAKKAFFGEVKDINLTNRNSLSVDLRPNNSEDVTKPPKSGFLSISLQGDRTSLYRRENAAKLIQKAQCPMPQLGMILENRAVQKSRWTKQKAMSVKTLESFGGRPTPRQRQAIDIAINTPDIALIQGPPGTGKTGTIAAIQTRLAEIAEKSEQSISKKILLTSYQHDAVDNAANRTFVYGLPALRIGGRNSQVDALNNTDRWRRELIDIIKGKLAQMPETPEYARLRQVKNQVISYLLTPGDRQQTARMLTEIYDLTFSKIPNELSDKLYAQKQLYSRGINVIADRPELEAAIKAVRNLSTDPISFADDGALQAEKALRRLNGLKVLSESDRLLLETASDWEPQDESSNSPSFLAELDALRARLLDSLIINEAPQAIAILKNPEIENLLRQIQEALYQQVCQSPMGVPDIIEKYLDELENDPQGVTNMIRQYASVLAATCQQSVSRKMAEATGNPDTVFETVIVDEAARANPLDLFIPMAKAERRIILVGDHRQLPQILEDEVERKLAESNEATRNILKMSLFERLFLQLREREAHDGIKRTVTLDTQYRMHSVLGDFVSRTFYECHGDPQIHTGRPDTDFLHYIPDYEEKLAAWINIPFALGSETKGKSKSRNIEAKHLARELRLAMESSPHFTFGVITFYRAQVTEIWNALCEEGIAERNDEGLFQVARKWEEGRSQSGKLIERLRVGTVDAFQGKEFDVVFLSFTRSNDIVASTPQKYQQKYGFLLLENRLCVAMSRQKRLLVVVGDLEMINVEATKPESERRAMREFIAFHELCKSANGIIRSCR